MVRCNNYNYNTFWYDFLGSKLFAHFGIKLLKDPPPATFAEVMRGLDRITWTADRFQVMIFPQRPSCCCAKLIEHGSRDRAWKDQFNYLYLYPFINYDKESSSPVAQIWADTWEAWESLEQVQSQQSHITAVVGCCLS